jgi:hypothetical protein
MQPSGGYTTGGLSGGAGGARFNNATKEGRQRMKLLVAAALVALMVALSAAAGCTYPTRFGPATGLVDLPTSDTVDTGAAEVALDYTKLEGGQQIWPARILLGVSQKAELGVGYAKLKDGESQHITSFAAKMNFLSEPQADFGLGVGAAVLDGSNGDLFNVYAVASKEFPTGGSQSTSYQTARARVRGHLGLMYTRISDSVSDNEIQPFVGADVTMPEGTAFVAEYKWTDFGNNHAAAAIRYPLSPKLTIQAGVARAGTILGQDDYRFIIGLSYDVSTIGAGG